MAWPRCLSPLAVTLTVVFSCVVSVAEPIPGHSIDLITEAMMDGLNLIRACCDNRAVRRVEVVNGTNKDMTESDGIAAANAHSYSFYTNSDRRYFGIMSNATTLCPKSLAALIESPARTAKIQLN